MARPDGYVRIRFSLLDNGVFGFLVSLKVTGFIIQRVHFLAIAFPEVFQVLLERML